MLFQLYGQLSDVFQCFVEFLFIWTAATQYESAEPDFSKCSEAEVEIDNMTENRENYVDENGEYQQGNFTQADAKCAERWNSTKRDGKDDWTAADVRD